jgi:hypothetical protein
MYNMKPCEDINDAIARLFFVYVFSNVNGTPFYVSSHFFKGMFNKVLASQTLYNPPTKNKLKRSLLENKG